MEPITPIQHILIFKSMYFPLKHMDALFNPYSAKSILFIHEMFLEPHMLRSDIIQPYKSKDGKQFGAIAIYAYEPL